MRLCRLRELRHGGIDRGRARDAARAASQNSRIVDSPVGSLYRSLEAVHFEPYLLRGEPSLCAELYHAQVRVPRDESVVRQEMQQWADIHGRKSGYNISRDPREDGLADGVGAAVERELDTAGVLCDGRTRGGVRAERLRCRAEAPEPDHDFEALAGGFLGCGRVGVEEEVGGYVGLDVAGGEGIGVGLGRGIVRKVGQEGGWRHAPLEV